MSIKLRLATLLGLLLLGFLAALVAVRTLERRELEQMVANDRHARIQLLNHWIDATTRALPQFAADAAQSDALELLLTPAATETGRKQIETYLRSSGVNALWIVSEGGLPRLYLQDVPGTAPAVPVPLSPADFVALVAETPNPRFFAEPPDGLLEVCVRRLQMPGKARRDWLVVARRWDGNQLRTLADLTESAVSLEPPEAITQPPAADSHIVLLRPLVDPKGHPVRTLRVEYNASSLKQAVQTDWQQALVFLSFGLLVLVSVAFSLQAWVLRPLSDISTSLARHDPRLVQALGTENTELGRVAQLVMKSFGHHEALKREVEERALMQTALEQSEARLRRTVAERAQLGRDLHDGVIQSLYAAGMGLAGIRALLHDDQSEAAARLQQTRAELNETIHDVRNFIIGLEPEALKAQTFSHAVAGLVETMLSLRPFRSTVNIDENLASRLSLSQRVHALQIAREALSNALRHGTANHVSVTLRATAGAAEFEIIDDGSGFEAGESPKNGQGLKNLAQRAQELGATFAVDSRPGQGTRVKLVFPLPIL